MRPHRFVARLASRSRLVPAGVAAIATLVCAAAASGPAEAAGYTCKAATVSWSSLPFTGTESTTLCDTGGTSGSGYCVNAKVPYSVAGWASPFVTVTGVSAGCYHIASYGGAESMWANISVKAVDPTAPWVVSQGTVWLRLAMNSAGAVYPQSGASPGLAVFPGL